MQTDEFTKYEDIIRDGYFGCLTISDLYQALSVSESRDEFEAAVSITIMLKDLVESHGKDHMEDAIEDCHIHMTLGSFDDDLMRRIAEENGVDFRELRRRLDEE